MYRGLETTGLLLYHHLAQRQNLLKDKQEGAKELQKMIQEGNPESREFAAALIADWDIRFNPRLTISALTDLGKIQLIQHLSTLTLQNNGYQYRHLLYTIKT